MSYQMIDNAAAGAQNSRPSETQHIIDHVYLRGHVQTEFSTLNDI